MTKKRKVELTVSKTISLPIDLLNDICDESEVMGKAFSESVQLLLRMALSMRRDERRREDERQAEETLRILKRGQ